LGSKLKVVDHYIFLCFHQIQLSNSHDIQIEIFTIFLKKKLAFLKTCHKRQDTGC